MKHLKLWLPATLLAAAAVLLIRSASPTPRANSSLERTLARQRTLPEAAVRALQAMRLVSAVQFAFFSAEKRFALPEELKQKGFLDPQWPHPTERGPC